jgi:hypothetical protein
MKNTPSPPPLLKSSSAATARQLGQFYLLLLLSFLHWQMQFKVFTFWSQFISELLAAGENCEEEEEVKLAAPGITVTVTHT